MPSALVLSLACSKVTLSPLASAISLPLQSHRVSSAPFSLTPPSPACCSAWLGTNSALSSAARRVSQASRCCMLILLTNSAGCPFSSSHWVSLPLSSKANWAAGSFTPNSLPPLK
ncbi:hypothetical protein D3C79_768390 [compost metagenome]